MGAIDFEKRLVASSSSETKFCIRLDATWRKKNMHNLSFQSSSLKSLDSETETPKGQARSGGDGRRRRRYAEIFPSPRWEGGGEVKYLTRASLSWEFFSFSLFFFAHAATWKRRRRPRWFKQTRYFWASIKRMKPHEYPPVESLQKKKEKKNVPVSREPNKPRSLIRRSLSGGKGAAESSPRQPQQQLTRRHKQNNKSCCGWGDGRRRAWISCPPLHRHCYSCHIPPQTHNKQCSLATRTRTHDTGRLPGVHS